MLIRSWKFEDSKQVEVIEADCFKVPWTTQMLSSFSLNKGFVGYVAEKGDRILGYIIMQQVLDEAEIARIGVRIEERRNGIASKLLNVALKEMEKREVKKIFLEVRRSNLAAQSMYEKFGFSYIAVRKLYYDGKEDALIMSKKL